MRIKHRIQDLFWKLGLDISRSSSMYHPFGRKKFLLKTNNIDIVIDIGANTGQFGYELRKYLEYKGKIISFEPLKEAYKLLEKKTKSDPYWKIFNFALGDVEETRQINVSKNLVSSSFLDLLPLHAEAAPASIYTSKQVIHIQTLDSLFSHLCSERNNIYMKIDTQGFDSRVIKGAKKSLPYIKFVQVEMSLVPLYKNEILFDKMLDLMAENGFQMIALEPGFMNPVSGHTLQVDGIFQRTKDMISQCAI